VIGMILPGPIMLAIQLAGIFRRWLVYTRSGCGNTQVGTKGWDGLDGRVHRIYPSSPTAWLHQDLPYGSTQWNSQA
jgi:hypothetical protein